MPAWEQVHWSGRPPPEPQRPPRIKPNAFARLVRFSARNALSVVIVVAVMSAVAAAYGLAVLRFDQTARPSVVLGPQSMAAEAALDRRFPGIDSSFVARLAFDSAGRSRTVALDLSKRLAAHPNLFASVEVPGSSEFYRRYGILYRSAPEIDAIAKRALSLRPLLVAFHSSPNIGAVAALAGQIDKVLTQGTSPRGFAPILDALAASAEATDAGRRAPVDWTQIAGLAADDRRIVWYVIAAPVPDMEQPAAELALSLSAGQPEISWSMPPGTTPQLVDWLRDAFVPILLAVIVTAVLLFAGLARVSQAVAVLACMAANLSFCAGFLAAAGAQLSVSDWRFGTLISGACLFSGFTYCAAYQRQRVAGAPRLSALMLAAQQQTLPLLALASVSVACWACWLPRAIAALTPIAAVALFAALIALALTLTLIPSVISLCEGREDAMQPHWLDALADRPPGGHVVNALNVAVLLMLAAGAFSSVFLAGLRFGDPPVTDGPNGREAGAPGFAIQVLAEGGAPARALAAQIEQLPEAGSVSWIEKVLPPQVNSKLATLQSLRGFLPSLADSDVVPAFSPDAELREDVDRKLADISGNPNAETSLRQSAARLRQALQRAPAANLLDIQADWFSGLSAAGEKAAALARLEPPQLSDLDPLLRRRFIAADGTWRIEVLARPGTGRLTFAAAVRRIAPDAAGRPMAALASNEIMHHETAIAIATALAVLAGVILFVLRNMVDWVVALIALLLYMCLAAAVMALNRGPVDPAIIAGSVAGLAGCCSATVLRLLGRRQENTPDGAWPSPGAGLRPALLPPLVLAGIAAALMASDQAEAARFGRLTMEFQLVAAAIAMLAVPRIAAWAHGLREDAGS